MRSGRVTCGSFWTNVLGYCRSEKSGQGGTLRNWPLQTLSAVAVSALILGSSAPAQAGQLAVKEVRASSTAPESMGVTFSPSNTIDGKVGTMWAEGEAAAGLGEWIEYKFEDEVELTRIEFYLGNWYSQDYYQRHNRMKRFEIKFSTGEKLLFEAKDKMVKQVVALPKPIKTRSVKFVLKEVYAGTTFNDTYLSEAMFFNDAPAALLLTAKPKASSVLTPATDYGPDKLTDMLWDTPWCEGDKGDGNGAMFAVDLPKGTALKEVRLLTGVAVSEETYKANGRPTRLKVELDGKTLKEVELQDAYNLLHTIPLEGASGSELRFTITGVGAGSKFLDTCVSELQLVLPDPKGP